jgi:hypothetical protein
MDELAVPEGLHDRILKATIGTTQVGTFKPSVTSQVVEWIKGLRFPLPVPQLAPVAMLILVAFMIFGQGVSANGSLTDVYQQGFQLAEETYKQSADAWTGNAREVNRNQPPVDGTNVSNEEQK